MAVAHKAITIVNEASAAWSLWRRAHQASAQQAHIQIKTQL
jgi:hypothetical protein